MKANTLKRTGWILIVCGLVAVGMSAAGVAAIDGEGVTESASVLAEQISAQLGPAAVGALLALIGVVLVLRAWFVDRRAKQTSRLQVA
ncbi:MAG: hypothetical protein AAF357_15925 [Verrucomicrobiota bacterium]